MKYYSRSLLCRHLISGSGLIQGFRDSILVAGLVALIGALRAIRIQPAESLREL